MSKKNIAKSQPVVAPKSASKMAAPLPSWAVWFLPVMSFVAYIQTLGFGFVFHDDDKMIKDNPVLTQGFSIGKVFGTDAWFMDKSIELYRPWQSLTYYFDYSLGGLSPLVYHFHNLAIYSLNTWLLYLLLHRFFPSGRTAFWGALLYPLMQMSPHVVAWLPARGDLYLFTFCTLHLISLDHFIQKRSKSWLIIGLVAFGLALLSKESAVALIPLGLIWWFLRHPMLSAGATKEGSEALSVSLNQSIKPWLPIAGLLLGAEVVLFLGYNLLRQKAVATAGSLSVAALFSNMRGLPEEVFKLFIPYGFSVMPMFTPTLMLGGIAILGILGWQIFKKKLHQNPIVWLGLAWWLGMLIPSMAYQPSFAGAAYDYLDHRAYFAMVGFWLIVLVLAEAYQVFTKKSLTLALTVLVGFWTMAGNYNARTYSGWKTYYQNAMDTNPTSGLAQLNYGTMYKNEGNYEMALPYMERAARLAPKYADAFVKLAEVQFNVGKYNECLVSANTALQLEPNNAMAFQFRGIGYGTQGKYNESLADLNKACELQPNEPKNHQNRAITLKNMKQWAGAITDYTFALKTDSLNIGMIQDRGICQAELNNLPAALADFEAINRIQPENGPAWYFSGRAKITMGDQVGGCQLLQKAAQMNVPEAVAMLQKVCQ